MNLFLTFLLVALVAGAIKVGAFTANSDSDKLSNSNTESIPLSYFEEDSVSPGTGGGCNRRPTNSSSKRVQKEWGFKGTSLDR